MIRLPRQNPQINADFSTKARITESGGIKLNFGQLNASFDQLSQAVGKGPRENPVDYSGARDLAEGIGDMSATGMKMIQRNQEMTDTRKLYDAETRLLVGQQELESLLQKEKDPNKWEQVAAEHMDGLMTQIDVEGMSERAKQNLSAFTERARMITVAKARNSGFAKNEQMTIEAGRATANAHKATGNTQGYVEAMTTLGEVTGNPQAAAAETVAGVYEIRNRNDSLASQDINSAIVAKKFDEADALAEGINDPLAKAEAQMVVLKARRDHTYGIEIAEDPDAFEAKIPTLGLTPTEENELRKDVYNIKQTDSAIATQAAQDDIARGVLISPLQLDRQSKYKRLTPESKAIIADRLRKGVPANDHKEFLGVAKFISDYKPTGQSNLDNLTVADLKAKINIRFDGALKAQLDKLADKMLVDPADVKDFGDKIAADAFADGYLQNYRVTYVEPREEGWIRSAREGTTLSPADVARTNSEIPEAQRLEPGEIVEDQRLKAIAAEKYMELMRQNEMMRRRGDAPKDIEAAAKSFVRAIGIGTSMSTTPAATPNPTINMDGPIPKPTMDGSLKTGGSPTMGTGDGLIPPPPPATLDEARKILKDIE